MGTQQKPSVPLTLSSALDLARDARVGLTNALDRLRGLAEQNGPSQSEALHHLGALYDESGLPSPLPTDLHKARACYEESANLGHSMSQYCLGNMYHYGQGGNLSLEQARFWYGVAAGQGVRDAQMHYARMLQKAHGGPQDIEAAAEWYLRAIEQGDELAAMNLALMHLADELQDSNHKFGLKLLYFAADRMLASAYLQLGHLSRLGIEIEQDIEASLLNYFVAAELEPSSRWGKEAAHWRDRILAPQPPELRAHYAQIARQFIDDRRQAAH